MTGLWALFFFDDRLYFTAGIGDSIRVIGGSQRRTRTAETEARILETTRQGPTEWYDPLEQLSAGQKAGNYPVEREPCLASFRYSV
jgi:hypothetical protein